MKNRIILAALLLAFTVTARAQEVAEATVIVYRNTYHATVGRAAPTLTANDEKLAVLDEGRYFVARIPVGLVIIKTGKKRENRVDIDARAGETYYMRVRAHPGSLFTRFELFRVTKDEYDRDAGKLRYVEEKDVKSPRVLKAAPPEATDSTRLAPDSPTGEATRKRP